MKFFPIYILLTIVTIAACTNNSDQYYDYALFYVILFQLHDYIAKNILKQDPHGTNYFGNKEVGKFLAGIMRKGATEDWRKVLKDATEQEISAKAMVAYFQPLTDYLKQVMARGAAKARESAHATLELAKRAMGLDYF